MLQNAACAGSSLVRFAFVGREPFTDPMIPTHSNVTTLSTPLRVTSSPRRFKQAGLCTLAITLLFSAGVRADPATADPVPVAELALHQQRAAPTEIRLKLHSIEDLRIEPQRRSPSEQSASTDSAEEIKKQAQTRYLARKLRKGESAVRQYVDLAWAEANKRERLRPELLIAIIQKESAFRPKVQSRYGAQGLMQVVRRWHGEKLHPSESLFDPEVNIRVGADVLEEYLALAGGDMDDALRKYSGNARGYVNTVLKETRTLARVAEQAASKSTVAQG